MAFTRLRQAIVPLILLLLVFVFIHACVPRPITDLRAVGVARISAAVLPKGEALRNTLIGRGDAVWKISLSGSSRWISEVRKHDLNSYPVAVRCDRRGDALYALGPYVGQVPITTQRDALRDYRPASGAARYDVYLIEKGPYRSEANVAAPAPSYDLGSERMEVCIRIAGGAMHGAYQRSNEVRLTVGTQR